MTFITASVLTPGDNSTYLNINSFEGGNCCVFFLPKKKMPWLFFVFSVNNTRSTLNKTKKRPCIKLNTLIYFFLPDDTAKLTEKLYHKVKRIL